MSKADIETGYENFCDRIEVDPDDEQNRKQYMPMLEVNWKVNMSHEMTEDDVRIKIFQTRCPDIDVDPYDDTWVSRCRDKWLNAEDADGENPEDMEDGIFECWKCRNAGRPSLKTKYVQRQTRSADEPMTNFVTCMMCKSNWVCA